MLAAGRADDVALVFEVMAATRAQTGQAVPGGIASCPRAPPRVPRPASRLPRAGAVLIAGHGRQPCLAWLCVPPLEHPGRDAEQDGGEHHEDAGLDALEGPNLWQADRSGTPGSRAPPCRVQWMRVLDGRLAYGRIGSPSNT